MQDYFPAFDLMSQEIDKTESGLSRKLLSERVLQF